MPDRQGRCGRDMRIIFGYCGLLGGIESSEVLLRRGYWGLLVLCCGELIGELVKKMTVLVGKIGGIECCSWWVED